MVSFESGKDKAAGAWRAWAGALILAAAGTAAYFNTFSAPFVFDDIPAIAQNPSIRDLRRPSQLLAPPAVRGSGTVGRPVVNLSLALNHALGGEDVRGYHAFNLLVHIGAGLVLWGFLRRTLRLHAEGGPLGSPPRERREDGRSAMTASPGLMRRSPPLGGDGGAIAFAAALLWLVHPLQTESVTCIIQRTESLAGLFFLTVMYCFGRSVEAGAGRGWAVAAWIACLLGSATKELMAMAPLLVLLFDRTFVAGTFRDAWRLRAKQHLALASTWLLVGFLVWRSESRGGTVGFGHGVAWWEYALTQCQAIGLYLKLALWPHPLVLDYGTTVVREIQSVWPQGLLIAGLLAATGWAVVKRPAAGFLGAWFFVILGPSSSVVPLVTQTMAEHRMYLPLAAVVVLGAAGLRSVAGRWFTPAVAGLAAGLVAVTAARNHDYRSVDAIWRDNIAKRPGNPRAHYTLGQLADTEGRYAEAIAHGEAAVRLVPADATARFNLAFSLAKAGRTEEAVAQYREAARLQPESADAHINLGAALVRLGRIDEAIAEYETVVRLKPDSGEDEFNLAQAYVLAGRTAEATGRYERAIKLLPAYAEGWYRLGNAWLKLQNMAAAENAFRQAVRLAPDHFEAHVNLAGALLMLGRVAEAVAVYEQALRLRPGDPTATSNLAQARERAAR